MEGSVKVSTATEIQIQEHKWIAFAHLMAQGEIPISTETLEGIAKQEQFESPFRLQLAEKYFRNLIRVMLEALHGPSRRSVIEFFGKVYEHEGKRLRK